MNTSSRYLSIFIFSFFHSLTIFSQSEADWKQIIRGVEQKKIAKIKVGRQIKTFSDYYKIDLNDDGFYEGMVVENSDSGSYIHLFKTDFTHFQKIFVDVGGAFSKVEKIELKKLSNDGNILLIYFNEGLVRYLGTQSRHLLYSVFIPKNIFEHELKISRGYVIFEEFSKNGHYHVRDYKVTVEDLDNDGIAEILIKANNIERVMILSKDKVMKML